MPVQRSLVENDHVVEALATNRADDALHVGPLPRGSGRRQNFLNPHMSVDGLAIRRECLDHVIVFNEAGLFRHLKSFIAYYHASRTHLSLAKDVPELPPVHPPELGAVVAIPQVGGLHHRYERRAA